MIALGDTNNLRADEHFFEIKVISYSPINLLGRFCHADQTLKDQVVDLAKMEQQLYDGSILAEIVHLPQSRIGNILSRPHLRDYEIEYLSSSKLRHDRKIIVDDLYLKMEAGIMGFIF